MKLIEMNSRYCFTRALSTAIIVIISLQIAESRHIRRHSTKTNGKKSDIPQQFSLDGNKFSSIGCFRDAWNRVIPALEGEHQLLMEPNYKARKYALMKCAHAAMDKHLKVFGIENGGQCFGAKDEHSLNKYGTAVECRRDGKGGPWSLQAYKFETLPINGGFSPWSRWTTCSKTCDHGVRRRMRTCSNPSPSNGGKDCSGLGPSVEGEICKDKECPTVLIDEAESSNNDKTTRLTTTPSAPEAPSIQPTATAPNDKQSNEQHHESNEVSQMTGMRKPTESSDMKKPTESSNGNFLQSTEHLNTPTTQSSTEPQKQTSSEETNKENSSDKQQEATKESPSESPRPLDQTIKISGDPMPLPNGAKETAGEGERAKNAGSETKEEKGGEGPKPGSTQSDRVQAPQGIERQGFISHNNHRTPSSEPFQFMDEPEDQRLSTGNPYAMPMHQSEGIKSHEQLNLPETASQGIDPRVVEDTYNGGPVVASSAVQLNTPLGPVVMGEVSPVNSNYNPMEAQNDQQAQQNDECFCPKRVCDAKADLAFLVDGSSDIPQIYFAHVLDFMKALTRGFSSKDIQVNVVAYGDDAASAFNTFTPVHNLHEIDDSIDSMSYMGGDPRTGNALMKVKNGLFKTFGRSDAKKALVLLTSGGSTDDTLQAAAQLRDSGIKLTTIGLGKLANVKELIDMSSEPKSSHVFTAFLDTLPDIMDDIVKGVCSDIDGKLFDKKEACVCGGNKPKASKDKAVESSLETSKNSDNKDHSKETNSTSSKAKSDSNTNTTDSKNEGESSNGKDKGGHNVDHSGENNGEHISISTHVNPHKSAPETEKNEEKEKEQSKETTSSDNKVVQGHERPALPQSQEVASGSQTKEGSVKLKTDEKPGLPEPQVDKNEKGVPKKDEKEHEGSETHENHGNNNNEDSKQTDLNKNTEQKNSQDSQNSLPSTSLGEQKNAQEIGNNDPYKQTDSSDITILDNGYSQLMQAQMNRANSNMNSNPNMPDIPSQGPSPYFFKEQGQVERQSQQNNQGNQNTNSKETNSQGKVFEATESTFPPKHAPQDKEAPPTLEPAKTAPVSAQIEVPNPNEKQMPNPEGKKENPEKEKPEESLFHNRPAGGANTFISGEAERYKDAASKAKECSVNLGVVLDSKTTAYGEDENAKKLLKFAKRLTHMFPVTPEGNRVGMMVYSGSPKLKVVHFDHTLDPDTMDKAIDSASFLNMEIKTGKVLNFAQEHLFSRVPSGKQNVLLLITDGVSYDDVTTPSTELKRRGVEIFVVGVGEGVISKELESIASEPARDHVIKTSYDTSDQLFEDIKLKICSAVQKKGLFCAACAKNSDIPLGKQHVELKRTSFIQPRNEANMPRRRGHLYHVLTEIERRR